MGCRVVSSSSKPSAESLLLSKGEGLGLGASKVQCVSDYFRAPHSLAKLGMFLSLGELHNPKGTLL